MTTPGPKRPAAPPRQRRGPRVALPQSISDLWARQLERSGAWLALFVAALIAVVVLFEPIQIWFEQEARVGELRAEVTKSKAAVASMQEDLKRWGDKAFIEAQARQRLLFVYPGDVSYLIVNDITVDDTVAVDTSAEVTTTDINWVDALVASFVAASVNGETK